MLFKTLMVMYYCFVVIYIEFNTSIRRFSQSNCCYNVVIEKPILKQSQDSSSNSVTDKTDLFRNNIKIISIRILKIRMVLDNSNRNFNTSVKILFKYHRLNYLFKFGIFCYNKPSTFCRQKYRTRILFVCKSDLIPMRC